MSLEIGATTLGGLKQGVEQGSKLKSLLAAVVQAALNGAAEGHAEASVSYKETFASCLTLLFEAARHDAAPAEVTAVLEEAGWSSDAIQQFVSLYQQHKDAIRSGAATSSPPLPSLATLSSTTFSSIIDVKWRVDDYLKSDSLDAVRSPSYLISLTLNNNNQANQSSSAAQTSELTFACNLQQLQDLLAKLKDAQKQIQQKVE